MENNSVMLSNLPYPSSSSSPVFSSAAPNPINLMLGIMKHEVDCFPYTRQGGGGPTAVDQSMIFDDRQYYDQCGGNDFSGGGGAGNKETNVGDDDDGDCTKICSSGTSVGIDKKTTHKMKKKKHRYAFQTRSQVDILDDGYRWRKYGQKAVKNNKFPRSYYRCTNHGCNVKKQIQRLSKDEGVVVTTYEGIHSHPIDNSTDNFEHILNQMQIYTNIHPPIS